MTSRASQVARIRAQRATERRAWAFRALVHRRISVDEFVRRSRRLGAS